MPTARHGALLPDVFVAGHIVPSAVRAGAAWSEPVRVVARGALALEERRVHDGLLQLGGQVLVTAGAQLGGLRLEQLAGGRTAVRVVAREAIVPLDRRVRMLAAFRPCSSLWQSGQSAAPLATSFGVGLPVSIT